MGYNASIDDDAVMYDYACASGNARIFGTARIFHDEHISGNESVYCYPRWLGRNEPICEEDRYLSRLAHEQWLR